MSVAALRSAIGEADAVLFATPEYNASIPGSLKNALDWVSRPIATNPLRNKPVAVVGASTGAFGAVWAQAELRKVLAAIGARVVDGEVAVGHAPTRFDENGRLEDESLREQLQETTRRAAHRGRPRARSFWPDERTFVTCWVHCKRLVKTSGPCYLLPQLQGETLGLAPKITGGGQMAARPATAAQKVQRELEDLQLVMRARNGDGGALDALIRRYNGFVRLKASSYFLAGGDSEDLVQEGLIGLYKAVRDFRADKETSFRSFAELCVTRQIITAIKTATRFKHAPLNTYVSFSHTPAGQESDGECSLGDALPGPGVDDPAVCVISTEELQSLVFTLGSGLSELEADALRLYLEGESYEQMAEDLECDTKTIDNALQRVKRKILTHQKSRQVLL